MFVTADAKKIIEEKRKRQYISNILPDLIKNMTLLGITKEELIREIEELYEKGADND